MEKISRSAVIRFFAILYCCLSTVEVLAEYFYNLPLIWSSKPFIVPILIIIYWLSSRSVNPVFLLALGFSWVANLFFISRSLESISTGAYVFLGYRVLIIYVVLRLVRFPGVLPVVLGSLPFVFIYLYVINVSYDTIGSGLVMFAVQGFFISFLVGLSVGNYILRSNKSNTLLLISTLMFAFTQFIFVIKLFFVDLQIFQPIAMALFAAGQYILCTFVLIVERKHAKAKLAQQLPA